MQLVIYIYVRVKVRAESVKDFRVNSASGWGFCVNDLVLGLLKSALGLGLGSFEARVRIRVDVRVRVGLWLELGIGL